MQVLVFQVKDDAYREFLEHRFSQSSKFPKWPDDYVLVAAVRINPSDTQHSVMETAFAKTNAIDCPWHENPEVTMFNKQRRRSTSVGDIVVVPSDKVQVFRAEETRWVELDVQRFGE